MLSHQINSIYLPAGKTPEPLYEELERRPLASLQKAQFYQIDDILDGPQAGLFKRYFQSQLPSYLDRMHWIEQGRCQAQAAILGLGLNGHCAFHEPHLPADFAYGELSLSPETSKTLKLSAGTKALSYGMASFMACKRVLLMVTGSHKAAILDRFLAADPSLPASQLRQHVDLSILCDQAAAGPLTEKRD